MPQAKKNKKKSAKKMKGKLGQLQGGCSTSTGSHGGSGSRPTSHEATPGIEKQDFPIFHSNAKRTDPPSCIESLYIRYKRATSNFKQAMERLVPAEIFEDTAEGLVRAAEYIADHMTSVDQTIMDDLKLAIRVRQRVAASATYGDSDAGHSHFIVALSNCWATLRLLARTKISRPSFEVAAKREDDKHTMENRFAALALEEDDSDDDDEDNNDDDFEDDDDDDDEEDLPIYKIDLPPTNKASHEMTFMDLRSSEDRMDAILFLMTMDDLMGHNSSQFQGLKEAYMHVQCSSYPESSIVEELMETATAVNFSIQQVASMEQEITDQHEHLNTIFRLLALAVFPSAIYRLSMLIRQVSPRATNFRVADATIFFGDALECGFRSVSDRENRLESLDADFCSMWKITKADLISTLTFAHGIVFRLDAGSIAAVASLQIRWKMGTTNSHASLPAQIAAQALSIQPWIPNAAGAFIGGTARPIMHTIRLLQEMSFVFQKDSGTGFAEIYESIYFPGSWDESRNKAKTIARDLDSMLVGDILPLLFRMCNETMLSTKLPYENELLPLFAQLKKFCNDPTKPISWTLAFSVHALLTSIFDVQGEDCVRGLGEIAKASFQRYMDQLQQCIDRIDPIAAPVQRTRHLIQMQMLQLLLDTHIKEMLESELGINNSMWAEKLQHYLSETEHRALWNPLCAGTLLSYMAYFFNVDCGSFMVDSCSQLRIVMHLFNGLTKHHFITPGELPLLDMLHSRLADCKAVWGGPLPERGELVKRMSIAYGCTIKQAIRVTDKVKISWGRTGNTKTGLLRKTKDFTLQQYENIKPEELVGSYGRVCLRDFTGFVDKFPKIRQTRVGRETILNEHAARVKDTLDWMKADRVLLAMNLTSIGAMLNEFVDRLCTELEWRPLIEHVVRYENREKNKHAGAADDVFYIDIRNTFTHVMAETVLGGLDFYPAPGDIVAVARTVAFMKAYFSQIDPSSIMWFTATKQDE
jgi:hypothetical protein